MEGREHRTLYRSRKNRMVAGVAGGLAEYFQVDPSLVRLIWVGLALMGGGGVLLYIIAALIVPRRPEDGSEKPDHSSSLTLGAAILVVVGLLIFLRPFIPRVGLGEMLVGVGLVLLGLAILSRR